jgi:replicative DNA helicase
LQQGQRWVKPHLYYRWLEIWLIGMPVALFSLEMASVQLITRLISSETGLSSEKLRTGKLENTREQLSTKVKNLEKHRCLLMTPLLCLFSIYG